MLNGGGGGSDIFIQQKRFLFGFSPVHGSRFQFQFNFRFQNSTLRRLMFRHNFGKLFRLQVSLQFSLIILV